MEKVDSGGNLVGIAAQGVEVVGGPYVVAVEARAEVVADGTGE